MLSLAILSCALAAGTCHTVADPGAKSYAVRVSAPAGSTVRLIARNVPRGWIASFCTPHVCSPQRVSLPVRTGTAAIQLSYVRENASADPFRAPRVTGSVL